MLLAGGPSGVDQGWMRSREWGPGLEPCQKGQRRAPCPPRRVRTREGQLRAGQGGALAGTPSAGPWILGFQPPDCEKKMPSCVDQRIQAPFLERLPRGRRSIDLGVQGKGRRTDSRIPAGGHRQTARSLAPCLQLHTVRPGATCPIAVCGSSEGTCSVNRAAQTFFPNTPRAQN